MPDTVGTLMIAVYADEEIAARDLEEVQRHLPDEGLSVVEAGLCLRSRSGRVQWHRRPKHARRRGASTHPGRAIHFRRGLRRRDLLEVNETMGEGQVAMVAVLQGPGVERIVPDLHSDRVIVNQVTGTDMRVRRLLASYGELNRR